MIINNNNNNGNGFSHSCDCCAHHTVEEGAPQTREPKQQLTELMKHFQRHDRQSMIVISRSLGWTGAHYFHFGKPFPGILHLLASLIAVISMMAAVYLCLFTCCPVIYFLIPLGLFCLLFISILAGVCCSLYWSVHTDEEFYKVYPNNR